MSYTPPFSIVYSCSFGDYDYTFGPLVGTPNTEFLRFGSTKPNRHRIWDHKPIPASLDKGSQTLTNRNFKFFPHKVLPKCDVAIYIDGNILVRQDLTSIIREFWESGADIALFKHPSGRNLGQEIDFSLNNRIPPADAPAAERQRVKNADLGLLDRSITENSILFYRMESSKLAEMSQLWWDELEQYSKRDQIGLPFVLSELAPKVHLWDWHFHFPADNNPYFARYGHRRKGRFEQLRQAADFMKDYSWEYRLLSKGMKVGGMVRSLLGRD